MRLAPVLTFAAGLAIAGGSAFMARGMIEARYARDNSVQRSATVNVVVAAKDIAYGQSPDGQRLTTIAWPIDAVPEGVFNAVTVLLPEDGGAPRRAKRAIAQGELVLASKISDFGEKVTIVQTLGPNLRAMAIRVNAETAVGGFVTPGDRVDILLTQGRAEALKTVTILQNTRVIGVDRDADERSDTAEMARTVTVEVTPAEGQRLALAQNAGILSLTLRTPDTSEDVSLRSIGLSDVLSETTTEIVPQVVKTVTVRRGTEISQQVLR